MKSGLHLKDNDKLDKPGMPPLPARSNVVGVALLALRYPSSTPTTAPMITDASTSSLKSTTLSRPSHALQLLT